MKGLTVRVPGPREIYEGLQTSTNSSGFARSSGSSCPSATRSCQEVYEGFQRSPDPSSVSLVSDGCDAAGDHSSGRGFKGILDRLIGACFKPWKNVKRRRSKRASPVASSNSRGKDRKRTGGHTSIISYRSSQEEKRGLKFTVDEINRATRNFSLSYKIGQGGSGTVYKAMLDDGTIAAVKCAKKDIHDEQLSMKIQEEIQSLSHIRHFNLVKILGYLEHQGGRMLIVEYVPNGNLREHLDGLYRTTLNLADRIDVAIDVAHAVTYLHMQDRPHRKIKSSNILLTEKFRAKVTDFWSACKTYKGAADVEETTSYLAPEYLKNYQLTEKSDVYSFGVLLVELISGRRLVEAKNLPNEQITITWAMKSFAEGDAIQVLDPKLQRSPGTDLAVEKILEVALKCLSPTSRVRPSMWTCADMLWSIRKDYREVSAMNVRTPPDVS
ncbi:hypothetical protein H6P81_017232 [Aristolochia fimbriata]|uniref:Protein kinase domain-containing protein n=1 Tax=Aristolochia fimbriata TaxID=158543 RepID=A0AAV7E1W5_ARIFI|nr:hypothetical protein H6P81_017232 [Aristolochia fimbriata]